MNANFVNNTLKSRFSGAKTAPLAVRVFTQGGGGGGGVTTLGLTLACELQTHFLSSLLSLLEPIPEVTHNSESDCFGKGRTAVA